MKIECWRLRDGSLDKYTYHVQINDIPIGSKTTVMKHFSDFLLTAEIFANSTSTSVVFSKVFNSEEEWRQRARLIPYGATEISATSDRVKFVVKPKIILEEKTKKTKTCSICGQTGHNARTCSQKKAKKNAVA